MKRQHFFKKLMGSAAVLLSTALLCSAFPAGIAAAETPDASYTGIPNSSAVLSNLQYSDINKDTWSAEAIYESGALGIVMGYGNKTFSRGTPVTREEALAIAYRAAGRESEAQVAGETLNAAKTADNKKTNTQDVWYDGYIQLALNDGLITQQNYTDAMNTDQAGLDAAAFHRKSSAQRQEMAAWLAKTLKMEPVRGQQSVFNNYLDWKSADPDKIPYIEAVLQKNIMSGDNSRFRPTGTLTREQAAQIIRNAEPVILPVLTMDKLTGTIETVDSSIDNTSGRAVSVNAYQVRNSSGKLHAINTRLPVYSTSNPMNEQQGSSLTTGTSGLVVFKNGVMGNSSLLNKGDRIEYIVNTTDNSVKYVKVISNTGDIRYVAAQIGSIDTDNLLLNVQQLFSVDYPDVKALGQNVKFASTQDAKAITYRYSKAAAVNVNGKSAAISDLYPDMTVILAIMNNNVVNAITTADFNINEEENRIVNGIVEENNPQLGYITLYNADGSGGGKSPAAKLTALRTYNYLNQNKVDVLKNHKAADIEDIEAGDTVFLKLAEDGSVDSVSAVDNYEVKYGKLLSKSAAEIVVQYDDGTQQFLATGSKVPVISNGKLDTYDSLRDGDRVKLQLNVTESGTALKEITIEGDEHFISNIYKGEALEIDDMTSKVNVLNLRVLDHGKWENTPQKVFTRIPMSEQVRMYYNGEEVDMDDAIRLLSDNPAYLAMEKDYGGTEKAVMINFINEKDTELLYSDNIAGVASGSGSFSLDKEYRTIKFEPGSIIVKNGRLVAPGSLVNKDRAIVVASRDNTSGDFNAGVVKIDEPSALMNGQLYRARIKQINGGSDFTVESFSRLNGTEWVYANTPKTFAITNNTRLLGEDGVADTSGFLGYGPDSYVGQTVYVLADDTAAQVISTAPYGVYNARGIVYDITGADYGDEGTLLTEPDNIMLRSVKGFNATTFVWADVKDMDLGLLPNTLIFKNGKPANPSDIRIGDTVRILKKEAGETGTAFIVFVE